MSFWRRWLGPPDLVEDQPEEEQRGDLQSQIVFMDLMAKDKIELGESCDEIPGASGPFGLCPGNPVPVNGPVGETLYLNRLRSGNGTGFLYHRLGSVASPVYPHPVDRFECVAADASEWKVLYMAQYFPRRSRRAPEGLTLKPWSAMAGRLKLLCRLDFMGTHLRIPDFPYGLPAVIAGHVILRSVSQRVAIHSAREVQNSLREHAGNWSRPYRLEDVVTARIVV